ncbi:MAG: 4-(cytidine 5'-diphospho)-2-C-methyl-D-erythritol kinase [bacterium]
MEKYEAKAHARITLGLDIIGRTDDGYHCMDCIKQKITLYDRVSVKASPDMKIISTNDTIPDGSDNTAWRAAQVIKRQFAIKKNVTINLDKNIPVMAGLAGGSSDAACVINLLNDLWSLGLSLDDKIKIGRCVGMDVPFFFYNGICADKETSGKPEWISNATGIFLVLVFPDFGISTKEAFSRVDDRMNFTESMCAQSSMIQKLKDILITNFSAESIGPALFNRFEEALFPSYTQLASIKRLLCDMGCDGALLSGSGSTIFGITSGKDRAMDIAQKMISRGYKACVGETK